MTDTLLRAIRRSKSGTSIKPKRSHEGSTIGDLSQFEGLELFLQKMADVFGFNQDQFGIAQMLGFVPGQIGGPLGFGDDDQQTLGMKQLLELIRSNKTTERFNKSQLALGRDELALQRQGFQAELAANPRDFMKLAFFRAGKDVPPALASAGGTPPPSTVAGQSEGTFGAVLDRLGIDPSLPGQPVPSSVGRAIVALAKGGAVSSGHTVSTVGEGSRSEVALLAPGSVVAPLNKKQRDRVESGDFDMREAVGAIMKQLDKTQITKGERGNFLDTLSAASDIAVGEAEHGTVTEGTGDFKLYRDPSGAVYVVENGEARHIPNVHTFNKYYDWGDVVDVEEGVVESIGIGDPVADTGTLIRAKGTGNRVYLLKDGVFQWIPNGESLANLGFTFDDVEDISDEQLLSYQEGSNLDDTSSLNPNLWWDYQGHAYISNPDGVGFTGDNGAPPNGLILTSSLTGEKVPFWNSLPMTNAIPGGVPDSLSESAFLHVEVAEDGTQTFYWVDFETETLWDVDGNLLIDHGFDISDGTNTSGEKRHIQPKFKEQQEITFIKSLIEGSTDATVFRGIGETETNPEGIENPISPFSGNVAFDVANATSTDLGLLEGFQSQFGIPFDDFLHEADVTREGIRAVPTGARSVFKPVFKKR